MAKPGKSKKSTGTKRSIKPLPQEIIIDVPIVNQRKDTKNTKNGRETGINHSWASRTCGICSLKMLLSFADSSFDAPVMKLVEDCLEHGGYIPNIGWKHQALVELAKRNGINIKRKYFKEVPGKKRGIGLITKELRCKKPVMVSICYKLDPKNGGHIVILRGIKQEGRKTVGFHVQDPDPRFKTHHYFITKDDFLKNWRGGLLYLAEQESNPPGAGN